MPPMAGRQLVTILILGYLLLLHSPAGASTLITSMLCGQDGSEVLKPSIRLLHLPALGNQLEKGCAVEKSIARENTVLT